MIRFVTVFIVSLLGWFVTHAQIGRAPAFDSVLSGEYRGNIVNSQGNRYQITVRLLAFTDRSVSGSYDVPQQQLYGIRFTTSSIESGTILLLDAVNNASFEGKHIPEDGAIDGTWNQDRTRTPLKLQKVTQQLRIQDPGENVPYQVLPFTANNRIDGVVIAGTLIIPDAAGKYPVFILINDSGTQDRDATDPTGHRPFLVIADQLARKKWASVRIDDRGIKTGSEPPLDQRANDIATVISRIKAEKNIDTSNIFLLGHGEGGLVAAIVAQKHPSDVQAIVCAATPTVHGRYLLPESVKMSEELYGTDKETIDVTVAMISAWLDVVSTAPDKQSAVQGIAAIADSTLSVNKDYVEISPIAVKLIDPDRMDYISNNLYPMLYSFATLDPNPIISNIKVPCLALVAERDVVVPSNQCLSAWQAIGFHNPLSSARLVLGVNHGFQQCLQCTVEEAERTPETVKPEVIWDVVEWAERVRAK